MMVPSTRVELASPTRPVDKTGRGTGTGSQVPRVYRFHHEGMAYYPLARRTRGSGISRSKRALTPGGDLRPPSGPSISHLLSLPLYLAFVIRVKFIKAVVAQQGPHF